MAATGGDIVISTIFFFTGAVLIVRFGVADNNAKQKALKIEALRYHRVQGVKRDHREKILAARSALAKLDGPAIQVVPNIPESRDAKRWKRFQVVHPFATCYRACPRLGDSQDAL
eukprot:2650991-Rhodomonas_salina.3